MTIKELSDFVNETDAGTELHSLISETNAALQDQLFPPLFVPDDAASDWLWNQLFELIAKADDILARRKVLDLIHTREITRDMGGGQARIALLAIADGKPFLEAIEIGKSYPPEK